MRPLAARPHARSQICGHRTPRACLHAPKRACSSARRAGVDGPSNALRHDAAYERAAAADAACASGGSETLECLLESCWPHQEQIEWGDSYDDGDAPVAATTRAPANALPIVICPGFGNNSVDYLAPFGKPELGLVTQLRERGFHASVLKLRRREWMNVGRNILTRGFWTSSLRTSPGYSFYLQKISDAVDAARDATGADSVVLLGHSAGGWLGRAFIAGAAASDANADAAAAPHPAVAGLVTLGTPHRAPLADVWRGEGGGGGGGRDMTGGALTWLDSTYPGAHFAETHGVRYACVAGRAVRGSTAAPRGSAGAYAASAYAQVIGRGDGVVGDAVVPTRAALLPGARNLVLHGVRHSMAALGTFDEEDASGAHVWYGSASVLERWLPLLADAAAPREGGSGGGAEAGTRPAVKLSSR